MLPANSIPGTTVGTSKKQATSSSAGTHQNAFRGGGGEKREREIEDGIFVPSCATFGGKSLLPCVCNGRSDKVTIKLILYVYTRRCLNGATARRPVY